MNIFTQNSDLKKSGVWGWTIPAHWVNLTNGKKINTCPNAGICAAFCYAKNGTYNFSNVKKAHTEKLELILNDIDKWKEIILTELQKKKYQNQHIRIHDAGDFFSKEYAIKWLEIAQENPNIIFYTYTKEVKLFKETLKDKIPTNFIIIYSFGGRQDHLINRETDRNSDVFPTHEEIDALKAKYSHIEGPTFDEYLNNLQTTLQVNNLFNLK